MADRPPSRGKKQRGRWRRRPSPPSSSSSSSDEEVLNDAVQINDLSDALEASEAELAATRANLEESRSATRNLM